MSYIYTSRRKSKDGKVIPPEFEGKMELENNEWKEKKPSVRLTYGQDWKAYNAYQTQEKILAYKILNDVVGSIEIESKNFNKRGRPFHLTKDMIKCCCIKVFCGLSSRRTISELKLVQKYGYIKNVPHFNSIIGYLNSPEMTKYFMEIYQLLSLPLKQVERKFAIDSTGFSTSMKRNWVNFKFSNMEHVTYRDWRKLHIVTGIETNVIVSADITKGNSNDSPEFIPLVSDAGRNFSIEELSADPAYLSRKNVDLVCKLGGVPYILPRSNATGRSAGSYNWKRMINFWKEHKEEFLQHYHQRSNVESTFSMMKRKFSDHLRSKKFEAQRNELFCMVICHNLSVLVDGIFSLDLKLKWN